MSRGIALVREMIELGGDEIGDVADRACLAQHRHDRRTERTRPAGHHHMRF